MLNSVLFPLPFSPTMATDSPVPTSRSTPESTSRRRRVLRMLEHFSVGSRLTGQQGNYATKLAQVIRIVAAGGALPAATRRADFDREGDRT